MKLTFTVSFPSHIGPENLILRNPPRCERNKKEYEALESFEDSLRLIWSRNDELLEALDEIDSQASTTSKREKAAYEKAMLEAKAKLRAVVAVKRDWLARLRDQL